MAGTKIKNFENLTADDLRRKALAIIEAGLEAIDTPRVIKENVSLQGEKLKIENEIFSLKSIERIFLIGVGKCALEAGLALEEILGERLTEGIVLSPKQQSKLEIRNSKLKIFTGTHPLPSVANLKATGEIIKLLSRAGDKDLVIFLVSGGASTLLCAPQGLTCKEEGGIFTALTRQGATIEEINTVRKHLSLARGGFLAKHAYPARAVTLIFSDVPGNDFEFIASGPTVRDVTTVADAKRVLDKFGIGKAHGLIETPKEDKFFKRIKNILLVSDRTALEAMAESARALKLTPKIMTSALTGEARDEGETIMGELHQAKAGTVLLFGGETTVTVRGSGRGGRNQEVVLSALRFVKENEILLAIASDGKDNSDSAGAICDKITKGKAGNLDIDDYLAKNNSYEFFRITGDYIVTGDTGSNVSDLIVAVKE